VKHAKICITLKPLTTFILKIGLAFGYFNEFWWFFVLKIVVLFLMRHQHQPTNHPQQHQPNCHQHQP
jgi:hypothetical protein